MNNEIREIVEYNNKVEKRHWNRFAAVMVFSSAMMYFLLFIVFK